MSKIYPGNLSTRETVHWRCAVMRYQLREREEAACRKFLSVSKSSPFFPLLAGGKYLLKIANSLHFSSYPSS